MNPLRPTLLPVLLLLALLAGLAPTAARAGDLPAPVSASAGTPPACEALRDRLFVLEHRMHALEAELMALRARLAALETPAGA